MDSKKIALLSILATVVAVTSTTQLAYAAVEPNENGSIGWVGPKENPYECWTPEGDACPIDSGDNAWILASSALVLIMTPGVAFFYGGLSRSKNTTSTIGMVFIVIGIISVQWVLVGYSIAFGPESEGAHDFAGGFSYILLNGVSHEAPVGSYADGDWSSIPHQTFMIFQAMFAIITPALLVGGLIDRIKFSALVIFIPIWGSIVYDPVAHWVWGGGFLGDLGALDFAGGTVVHITSGWGALAGALILGRRIGYGKVPMEGSSVPLCVLGASLLWFGWFGFNAGSELAADGVATSAFVVTNTATGMASVAWILMSWAHTGKASITGAATGAIAGLVAITPASGFVAPMGSLIIGLAAGILCYGAVVFKNKRKWDDAADVWGVHGIGGTVGAILTGVLANEHISGAAGGWEGNIEQIGINTIAAAASIAYAFGITLLILKIMDAVWPGGIRVTPREEEVGLDLTQHGERAYISG